MATPVVEIYTNARVLIDGQDISGDCNECTVSYGAESLDRTAFGMDTRQKVGGLLTLALSLKGWIRYGSMGAAEAIDPMLFNDVDPLHAPAIVTVAAHFPVVGEASAFSFRADATSFNVGAPVGGLVPFTFTAENAAA